MLAQDKLRRRVTRQRPLVILSAALALAACASHQGAPVLPASDAAARTTNLLPVYVFNVMWDVMFTSTDHMSTVSASERKKFPSNGQTWYLAAAALPATGPLYREYKAAPPSDHMDSSKPKVRGYVEQEILGYGLADSSQPGTRQLLRYYDPATGDHVTPGPHQRLPAAYALNEKFPLWSYPRYNNRAAVLLGASANGVTAEINKVAGGAVWSWTWKGRQFINTHDYGREMQMSLFYKRHNPTQAGDGFYGDLADMHGSPLVSSSAAAGVIKTASHPLEWNPRWFGAARDQLAIYTDVLFGTKIDLGFKPGVAAFTTSYTLPNTLPSDTTQGEIPTAYLLAAFDSYYTVDAKTKSTTQVYPASCSSSGNVGWVPPSGYGGVIIATKSGGDALGVYSKMDTIGGPTDYFTLWNFIACNQTSKFSAVHTNGWPAGTASYTTYILTGRLATVESNMYALYTAGY
jgi:hypothetical protein